MAFCNRTDYANLAACDKVAVGKGGGRPYSLLLLDMLAGLLEGTSSLLQSPDRQNLHPSIHYPVQSRRKRRTSPSGGHRGIPV